MAVSRPRPDFKPTPFWRWVAVAAIFLIGLLATAALVPAVHDACCHHGAKGAAAAPDENSRGLHHCVVASFAAEGGWWPDVPSASVPGWRVAEKSLVALVVSIHDGGAVSLPPVCGPPAGRARVCNR